jgi:peptidyl-prolyl cis-trans isomerase SurA
MYNSRFIVIALTAIIFESCKTTPPATTNNIAVEAVPEPVIIQLGNQSYTTKDFALSFEKNKHSLNNDKPLSPEEYLDLFTNMKLKVLTAQKEGNDTTQNFKDEISSYREILSQNFLNDKDLIEKFALEAYERSKVEVAASHLLVRVPELAAPEDTLVAYEKAQSLWRQLKEGANFEELAAKASDDPSAKTNNGDLGTFTVFQMVYPFENAAYNTPVGEFSKPFRTVHGYHIVKVINRQTNRGKLQVAHVMISAPEKLAPEQQEIAEQRATEAYNRLKSGEDWDKIVREYSDDKRSAVSQGALPVFGIGSMIKPFEEAAYGLKQPGDITSPVKTAYGWHIIKLLQKLPIESYEEAAPAIRQKVSQDSRGKHIEKINQDKIRTQYPITENLDVLQRVGSLVDSTLLRGKWKLPVPVSDELMNAHLFVLARKAYSAGEFLNYLRSKQKPVPLESSVPLVVKRHYNNFVNEKLVEHAKSKLEQDQPEFQQLMEEIKDGVLLSNMMEKYVWGKSLSDSLGQVKVYEQNREKYQYPERALATLVIARDTARLNQARRMLSTSPYKLELKGEDLFFEEGETTLTPQAVESLKKIVVALSANPNYIVELNGSRDEKEVRGTSEARLRSVFNFLTKNDIPITRIIEKNHDVLRNASNSAQNRKIGFVFYSTSAQDVAKVLNTRAGKEEVTIKDGYLPKDSPLLANFEWKPGEQTHATSKDKKWILIKSVEGARLKTFEEARGAVINDYQQILEKQWLQKLKEEYPATVNRSELNKVK